MDLFEQLAEDHVVIERTLDAFEGMVESVERGSPASRRDSADFVTFFEEFADTTHHDMEEEILIPALVEAGYDWYDGPAARLRREHRHERYLLRSLRDLVFQGIAPRSEGAARFASVARTFIDFVRQHIDRETNHLFAAARDKMTSASLAKVNHQLERFSAELRQRVDLPRLLELSNELCARYVKNSSSESAGKNVS